jgi:two-component system cell cycle sensor histidine kinase/response regulator CckA
VRESWRDMTAYHGEAEDYRRLLEYANAIILRYDTRGRVVYLNPFGLRFFGFTGAELTGRELIGSIVPRTQSTGRDLAEMIAAITARPEAFSRNENENLCRDGRRVWVAWTNQGLFDGEGRLQELLCIGNEVTDRRRVESDLWESRRMLQLVLDTIPVRVFWKDLNLNYLGCNRPFALDSGLSSPQELIGRNDYMMGWAAQAERYQTDDREVIERDVPKLNYEEPQTTPDGGQIWLRTSKIPLRDAEGRVAGVLGTYEDITARKQAEEAIRSAKEEWERTFDTVPDLIAILDAENRIVRVNRPLAPSFCPHRLTMRDGQPHSAQVFEERLGGHFLITTVPLKDESGGVSGTVHLMRDLTESLKAEEERRRLEKQVQQAQKLESLGVLADGIALDFNNLLMAILGHAGLALQELPPGSPARQSIEEVEAASRRAAELTRQLLAYSGKAHLETVALDLGEAVRDITHILQVSISKKVSLRFHFAGGLPAAEADPSQLRQAILNLIVNASEAIGDREGTITVSTGLADVDQACLAQCLAGEQLPAGPYDYLEVADTGCGMQRETLDRIFDPFFTTKFAGRGLGLAVVQGIVRRHRGAVRVESEPGKGTSFRILLPVAQRAPETGRPPSGGEQGWTGRGTVLLAEDEELVLHAGTRMLERLGFRVLPAADGQAALELLERHGGGNSAWPCWT